MPPHSGEMSEKVTLTEEEEMRIQMWSRDPAAVRVFFRAFNQLIPDEDIQACRDLAQCCVSEHVFC